MHSRTRDTLEELRAVRWFEHVGADDTRVARILGSWSEAVQSCSSPVWRDLCRQTADRYSSNVREQSPERFAAWNAVVEDVRPVAEQLVAEKTGEIVAQHTLPQTFVASVNWDILHLCMEAEFADVFPPGFYASQAYLYLRGRFPCGWDGRFPQGRLVIY